MRQVYDDQKKAELKYEETVKPVRFRMKQRLPGNIG